MGTNFWSGDTAQFLLDKIKLESGETEISEENGGLFLSDNDGKFLLNDKYEIRNLENFKTKGALDYFTTSGNVGISDELVNHIDGHRSVLITQASALATHYAETNVMQVNLPIYKQGSIAYAFDLDTNADVDSFRVELIANDGSDRVVKDVLINATGNTRFIISDVTLEDADTTLKARIYTEVPNDANTLIVDNFRIHIGDREVKNFTVSETVTRTSYTSKNGANQVLLPTTLVDESNSIISVTNTDHTRYTFLQDADFTATISFASVAETAISIVMYDSSNNIKLRSYSEADNQGLSSSAMNTKARAGDYLVYFSVNAGATNEDNFFSVTATATSSGTVFASDAELDGVGEIVAIPTSTVPKGFLKADGSIVSRTAYSKLFDVIGTTYGIGNGSTTFGLPNLEGQFLRGDSSDASIDPDGPRAAGSSQSDEFASHTHGVPNDNNDGFTNTSMKRGNGAISGNTPSQASGGNETRPVNVAVNWCIRYESTKVGNLIIENYDGSFETEERLLNSNHVSVTDISDFTVTGLEVGEKYMITGQMRIYARSAGDNAVTFRAGASGTGEVYGTTAKSDTIVADNISNLGISIVFTASSPTMYAFHGSTVSVYGDGSKFQSFIQVTKLPKKQGVDTLNQIVNNRPLNGSEYPEKGEFYGGKQLYSRLIETSVSMSGNVEYLLTNIGTGKKMISLEVHGSNDGSSFYSIDSGTLNQLGYYFFNESNGDIRARADAFNHTSQRIKITYTY